MSTKKQTVRKPKAPVQLAQYRVTVKERNGIEAVYDFDTVVLHGGRQGEDSVIVQSLGRPEDVAELAESAKDSMVVIRRHAMEHVIHARRADRAAAAVAPTQKSRSVSRRKAVQKKAAPKVEKK